MPMVYEPRPFELVIFEGDKGILIPDHLYEGDELLSFVRIGVDGSTAKDEKNKRQERSHFKSAKMIEVEEQGTAFLNSANAIICALRG